MPLSGEVSLGAGEWGGHLGAGCRERSAWRQAWGGIPLRVVEPPDCKPQRVIYSFYFSENQKKKKFKS